MRSRLMIRFRDTSGGIAPLAAIVITLVIGFGSLAVDVGSFYYQRRILQGVADLAAMAAAETLSPLKSASSNLGSAQAAAALVIAANGYTPDTLTNVVLGTYSSRLSVSPGARFQPGTGGTINAVNITLNTYTPMFLGAIFLPKSANAGTGATQHVSDVQLGVGAVAASVRLATFQVGSRLLSFQGGIVNALLSSLLGSSVNLSLMDYNGLASARIDLLQFSSALATRLNLNGPTYSSLYAAQAQLSDVLYAAASANAASPQSNVTATNVLLRLAGQAAQGSNKVDLSRLINLGPFSDMPVGGTSLITATVSAYDLLTETAQVANGNSIVSSNLGATIPGLLSAKLTLSIGERPVGTPWVSVGSESTQAYTAQTRLLVQVTIGGPAPLPVVNLPIYLELATASATLNQINCEPLSVTIGTKPALFNAWIANVTPADMTNYSTIPNPGPAAIASLLGLGSVSARANATMTNLNSIPLTFSASDIQSATPKTASTTAFTGSLFSQLLASLQLTVLGLPIIPPGALAPLTQVLAAATTPIDTLLSNTLGTLGISLGQADVWVTGVRCDGAVLVN